MLSPCTVANRERSVRDGDGDGETGGWVGGGIE